MCGLLLKNYKGRFGNAIIQYAVLYTLAKKYNLPYKFEPIYWDKNQKLMLQYENGKLKGEMIRINGKQKLDFNHLLNKNVILNITGFFQNQKYLNHDTKDIIYNVINNSLPQNIIKKNEIIVHIRCGDLWKYNKQIKNKHQLTKEQIDNQLAVSGFHPVLPIKFYKLILKNEKLPIRFVTESIEDPYIKEIKKHFPNAIYQSDNVLLDFCTLLSAKKLVLSISTYAWAASWLTKYADIVIFPLCGFFHPKGKQLSNLLVGKPNYIYYDFNDDDWHRYQYWKGDEDNFKYNTTNMNMNTIEKLTYNELLIKYPKLTDKEMK